MPVVYIATMMESKHIAWRPKFTSGLSDDGPDDKMMVIEFNGDISDTPWIITTSHGYPIDFDELAKSAPELFNKGWLKGRGHQKAIISGMGSNYIITMKIIGK